MKKKNSLRVLIACVFIIFALLTIVSSSFMTYADQTEAYHDECVQSLKQITTHLSYLIKKEGSEFIYLEEYYKENSDKLFIPEDFVSDIPVSKREFYEYVGKTYPDRHFGVDIDFPDLDDTGRCLYVKWRFEYWLSVFMESAENFNLSYVYYIYPSDDHKVVYMFDPSLSTKEGPDGKTVLYLADEVFEDPQIHPSMWKAWDSAAGYDGIDKIDNEFGFVYTYCLPLVVNGEKLGLLCADIDVASVNSSILRSALRTLAILSLVLVVGTLCISLFVKKHVLNRIVFLEKGIKKYSDEKDPKLAEDILKYKGRDDELGILYSEFSDMVVELEEYMKNLQSVTAEKERIGAELDVATHIQASMLPSIFPPFPEREDIDLYASMNPAKEVGGDFYDFFLLDEKHLAVVMADVSGKGVPAALIMVIAKTLIKNHLMAGEDLEKAMEASNVQLLENNDEMLFVTAWVGVIDLETGVVEFSDAGHEPAFVLKQDGTVVRIKHKKKRPPLATIEGMKYVKDEFTLDEGDRLFLYTDGVPEATDAKEELYGMTRLEQVLSEHTSDIPKDILSAVHSSVDEFVGSAPQFDDMTMLAFVMKKLV